MILKEKERTVIQDLQTQEKAALKNTENTHSRPGIRSLKAYFRLFRKRAGALRFPEPGAFRYSSQVNCNDSDGRDYQPKAAYTSVMSSEDKEHDAFLATDCIGTEKLISGEYNSEVFAFEDSGVRKLLADIQVEEQNHAEMLYKYKAANGMF